MNDIQSLIRIARFLYNASGLEGVMVDIIYILEITRIDIQYLLEIIWIETKYFKEVYF